MVACNQQTEVSIVAVIHKKISTRYIKLISSRIKKWSYATPPRGITAKLARAAVDKIALVCASYFDNIFLAR